MNAPQPPDIFNVNDKNFETTAIEIFQFQRDQNEVYRKYVASLPPAVAAANDLLSIPFLPVGFFKTHEVRSFSGPARQVFTSSGTTGMVTSAHYVKDVSLYETSFTRCFEKFYGDPGMYAFLGLLPSYLERQGSSLVYMVEKLIRLSGSSDSGFFLDATSRLREILKRREEQRLPTFLFGVTFALLDFAALQPMPLKHTIVMETGGMKGRRKELTREEVHSELKNAFRTAAVHSEYGMTELLSQAYSKGNGIFYCPPWMKVLVRDEDDPFRISYTGTGLLCIADLANLYSCSFIETADMGRVYGDGSFEVIGRIDNSDIRGCSLLIA